MPDFSRIKEIAIEIETTLSVNLYLSRVPKPLGIKSTRLV
jgi:hypothetical protein